MKRAKLTQMLNIENIAHTMPLIWEELEELAEEFHIEVLEVEVREESFEEKRLRDYESQLFSPRINPDKVARFPAPTYAEAATMTLPEVPIQGGFRHTYPTPPVPPKPQEVASTPDPPKVHSETTTKGKDKKRGPASSKPQQRPIEARAIVLHAAPNKYKLGQMRQWIEEDNRGSLQILGIRWLLREDRRLGKLASSLVIYLNNKVNINWGVHMGRKIFRTTEYNWDR